jgi:hypothetical protein
MKPTKRKLSLHAQTLRHLTTTHLGRVFGGVSSARGGQCSTLDDTGCLPSGNDTCQTTNCTDNTCTYGLPCTLGNGGV